MNKIRVAIIGAGISGLSAGFFIKEQFKDNADLTIYEKDFVPGGTIKITRENGFTVDWGANGFLDKEPLTLEFIKSIGLSDKLLPADKTSEKRFIYRNDKLWEISAHPLKFMKSGLLTFSGRMRIAGEYFVKGKNDDTDETVFDFASRRIGREAAEILISPMVSGIFGGDARELSLKACFPIMREMEEMYGGLIKAMLAKKKEARKSIEKKSGGPAGPSGHLTSFQNGLYTIIEKLHDLLKENICLSCNIESIQRDSEGKYVIESENNKEIFDNLILAIPAYRASQLVKSIDNRITELLASIPYSGLAVACQGYKLDDLETKPDGFGFLIPKNQNRKILGSIWTSTIFPSQAPEGIALFRTMIGGAGNDDILNKNDSELAEIAHLELTEILGIKSKPVFEKLIRWPRAIPQYVMGHPEKLDKITNRLGNIPGLYLAGNAYTGVGLNDCIKRSNEIVERIYQIHSGGV